MSETSRTRRIASLTAHVPEDVAVQVKALAELGERSISREIVRALRRHLAVESASMSSDGSRQGQLRSGNPAARRETSITGEAVELAGERGVE